MRIVALHTIADGRGMDGTFNLGRVFIGVARNAQLDGRRRGQLHASHVAIHPNFVAARAAHGDR